MADPKRIADLTAVAAPAAGFTLLARDATRPAGDRIVNVPIDDLANEVQGRITEIGSLQVSMGIAQGDINALESQVLDLALTDSSLVNSLVDKATTASVSALESRALVNDASNPVAEIVNLKITGPVETPVVAASSNSLTLDWSVRRTHVLSVSGAVTISETNAPADPAYDDAGREIVLINTTGSDQTLNLPVGWLANSNRPVTSLKANERLSVYPRWDGSEIRYSYEGDQSRPLAVGDGGTGTDYGVSEAPTWTQQVSGLYDTDKYNVNFGEGVYKSISTGANLTLVASSGRPSSGLFRWQKLLVQNSSGSPIDITFRGEWGKVGIVSPYELAANSSIALEFWAHGTAETDVFVIALTGSATTGGDPPPASTLTNGLIAAYPFNDLANTFAEDVVGTADLTPVTPARFSVGATGKIGNGWQTFVGGSSYMISTDAGLHPDEAEVRTYVFWAKLSGSGRFMGFNNGSSSFNPYIDVSGGFVRIWYSLNGSSYNTTTTTLPVIVNGTAWQMFVYVVDRTANFIRVSVDASAFQSQAGNVTLTGNGIQFSGVGATSPLNGIIDQLLVYDRELTTAELEQLYGGGTAPVDILDELP
jgi:hypothetical protein